MENCNIKKIIQAAILLLTLLTVGCGQTDSETIAENETTKEQLSQTGTESETAEASRELFAMDTYMTIYAYGTDAQKAVDEAAEEIERLDALLSTGSADSEISKLNREGTAALSEDSTRMVERSLELYNTTEGAFDIAIYPIMEAWGFTGDTFRVPNQEELKQLLTLTDAENIAFDSASGEISLLKEGMQIDLGGIAKGYTSGKLMDIFKTYQVSGGLVNLGGNVQVYGTKQDGSSWRVAIQDPEQADTYMGVLSIQDKAVITSGGYERYFEEDGITYHHIIDPSTGYPARSGLSSVTIVSADGTLADGLSTSMYVLGLEKAKAYWETYGEAFDMILITDEREIYVTAPLADAFESDYEVTIITRNE